jgi:KaiC/GvpD/RAD55 family RecA-like ATPase
LGEVSDQATWLEALGKLERSLLAAWVAGPALRERWTPDPAQFSDARTRALAAACRAVAALGASSAPGVQVIEHLSRSGDLKRHWSLGQDILPVAYSTDPDADLARHRDMRTMFALHQRLVELASGLSPGGDLGAARKALLGAAQAASGSEPATTHTLSGGLLAAYQLGTRPSLATYSTGFGELDSLTGGTRPGHVWALGAPTNWGKSSLLLAFADHHVSTHSSGALLVTFEDSPELLFTRWLARRGGIDGRRLRDARMTYDEINRAAAAVQASGSDARPVILDGRGRPVEQIARDIATIVATHSTRLVLVDYLQAITAERQSQDRRGEINFVARTLTDAIKTSGAAGILASQLTGEDLRESRDVEHAAEVVLIGRKSEDGARSLFLKKNKTGPNDAVLSLDWDSVTGAFLTERQETFDDWIPDA